MIVSTTHFRKHSCQSSLFLIRSGSVFLLSRKHLLTGPNTDGLHAAGLSCQVPYSGYQPCTIYPLRIGKPVLLGICLSSWYFRYSSWLYRNFSRIKKKWERKGGWGPFVPSSHGRCILGKSWWRGGHHSAVYVGEQLLILVTCDRKGALPCFPLFFVFGWLDQKSVMRSSPGWQRP